MKKSAIRIVCLLLIAVTAAGCGRSGPEEPADSRQRIWGIPVLTREELTEAVLSLPETAPAEREAVLTYDGAELPCLSDRSRYFLTVDRDADGRGAGLMAASEGRLALDEEDLTEPLETYMAAGTPLTVYLYDDETFSRLSVVLTTLPVITIETGGAEIGRDDVACDVTLFRPREGSSGAERAAFPALIHMRGATSTTLPKVGHAVELYEKDRSDTRKASLLSMRKDDDWILNPVYSDESKIRDAVAWRVWEAVGAHAFGDAPGTVDFRYVEVILDGTYHGFYVLMEKLDRKTVGAGTDGALFKGKTWAIPSSAAFRAADGTTETCCGVELKYPDPGKAPADVWQGMAEFTELVYEDRNSRFVSEIEERVDVHNMLDYWLFLQIVLGSDNTWKNMYFADFDGKIRVLPWDLDVTFGLAWSESKRNYLYRQLSLSSEIFDFRCSGRLIEIYPGAADYVKERWAELTSSGALNEERIIGWAETYWNELHTSGAWARNLERWPDTSAARDLTYFSKVVIVRFRFLSDYLENLKDAGD